MAKPKTPKQPAKKGVPAVAGAPGLLRITAVREGFRRAGRAWSTTPTEVDATSFSAEQIAALNAEPMLVVEFRPAAPAGGGQADAGAKE